MKIFQLECGMCKAAGPIKLQSAAFFDRRLLPSTWDCPSCRAINKIEWVFSDGELEPTGIAVVGVQGRRPPEMPRNLAELAEWAAYHRFEISIMTRRAPREIVDIHLLGSSIKSASQFSGHAIVGGFPTFAEALDAAARRAFGHWKSLHPS